MRCGTLRPNAGRSFWGGVALGLNWVALFGAYRLLNVSLATLIYYAGPMLVMLFSPLLFREKLTGIKIAAILLVACGLLLISGSIAAGGLSLTGLLTAAGSALFFSAVFLRESMTALQILGAVLVIGGALLGELPGRRPGGRSRDPA